MEKKDEYEFLSSKPSNYEVPQPSIKSKSEENCKNTLQYDVPGTIVNQYETPMDAWGALRCGITLTEPTPVDAEHTESMLVASGAYEPMWSGETSDSRYGSIYLSEGDSQTTGQSPKHGFQPTDPIDVPTNVHIRNVRHSEGSLLFMQSIVHSVASL